ncbi:globin family protein [Litoribrevibacter albus]|uniref:Hemoglobin n=1 Tax=Litoribrevibacter albus TaxID=1473156 RepID=A0AA37SD29_9GAMM|nr:globin family protein [Litoribrevibacter albus]GLQ32600.1 hemoglobin [Litoribrevibacter albus]
MTPEQVQLVQESWEKVVPISEQAAELFYGRLFELDPSLKPLFSGDIKEQGRKLMKIITLVVRGLQRFEQLKLHVWQLGRRHTVYKVEPHHYQTVATALLWTLEQGLQSAFTPEVKAAWVEAYTIIAGVMQDGANSPYANQMD